MNIRRAKITAVSHYLPERRVTNKDLEKIVDTSDEWIVERTGIHERYVVAKGQATSDLAAAAAQRSPASDPPATNARCDPRTTWRPARRLKES